jgi:hypothetical protein
VRTRSSRRVPLRPISNTCSSRRFSNSMSSSERLACCNAGASHAMSLGSVSCSCHFFRDPTKSTDGVPLIIGSVGPYVRHLRRFASAVTLRYRRRVSCPDRRLLRSMCRVGQPPCRWAPCRYPMVGRPFGDPPRYRWQCHPPRCRSPRRFHGRAEIPSPRVSSMGLKPSVGATGAAEWVGRQTVDMILSASVCRLPSHNGNR